MSSRIYCSLRSVSPAVRDTGRAFWDKDGFFHLGYPFGPLRLKAEAAPRSYLTLAQGAPYRSAPLAGCPSLAYMSCDTSAFADGRRHTLKRGQSGRRDAVRSERSRD